MSSLKPIEPSAGFDATFRANMAAAIARKHAPGPIEAFAGHLARGLENLRDALVPAVPVTVRVMAAFLFFISAGIYIYSIQPASPYATGVEGVILVQGRGGMPAQPVTSSRALKEGDVITTGAFSQFDIVMACKYTVRVKPDTTLKIARLTPRAGKGAVSLQLAGGNMLVDIEKGFKPSRFDVVTGAGTATALGTKFSVNSSGSKQQKMDVDVLEGRVRVKSSYRPSGIILARQTVIVGPGRKTGVVEGDIPQQPQRLVEDDWRKLEELYQIGRKPRVILLIKNTPDRVRQLLAPCAIYLSDEKPRELPPDIEQAVRNIEQAIKTSDVSKHLEGISILELMVQRHPDAKYNAQLLLYIGSYYEYVGRHKDAIRIFDNAAETYPESQFAPLALAASGIIYDEKLTDKEMAKKAFDTVLKQYPDSLEAIYIDERLGVKKAS
jgi:hypothetical protein